MFYYHIRRLLWTIRLRLIPRPTNKRLGQLFAGTDSILIKEEGVYKGKAEGTTIVLRLTDSNDIKTFQELMEIVEPKKPGACMCLGSYAIELYQQGQLGATIGLHHGHSIRYESWNSDAELAKAESLLQFLAERGLRKPLDDLNASQNTI